MDESHTCLVIVDLQKEGFEEYACDTLLSLGLNIDHFKKLLEPVEPGSAMELRVWEPQEVLAMRILGAEGGPEVVRWDMNLIDIDAEHMCVPDDEYQVWAGAEGRGDRDRVWGFGFGPGGGVTPRVLGRQPPPPQGASGQ